MSANRRVGRLSARSGNTRAQIEDQIEDEKPPVAAPKPPQSKASAKRQAQGTVKAPDVRAEPSPSLMPGLSAAAQALEAIDDAHEASLADSESAYDEGGELLTRRSRVGNAGNDFDLPEDYKKPGWDYEWKTTVVEGKPVDSAEMAHIHEQGWRPVRAADMPKLVPPGYRGKTIERRGMILCTRPMHLTLQARAEDYEIAERQKREKLEAASAVPTARPGLINPFVDKMELVGEVGSHRAAAKG